MCQITARDEKIKYLDNIFLPLFLFLGLLRVHTAPSAIRVASRLL